MFGDMVHLQTGGEYGPIYEKVQAYLAQHFTRLPKVNLYYEAKGTLRSENRPHQIVTGGFVVVQIYAKDYGDTIGLLVSDDQVELDSVSNNAIPELRMLYGYHE